MLRPYSSVASGEWAVAYQRVEAVYEAGEDGEGTLYGGGGAHVNAGVLEGFHRVDGVG